MDNLERYILAQDQYYNQALKEIKQGRKQTHWMWFIFPQIRGLGHSQMANYYAINDFKEARDYYHNDLLREHLIEISQALLDLKESDPVRIFGSIDAMKLRSSMTLFSLLNENRVFDEVLDKFYDGRKDNRTLEILNLK